MSVALSLVVLTGWGGQVSLRISLLGPPHIERDARVEQPRGRKAWGLLAYLTRRAAEEPTIEFEARARAALRRAGLDAPLERGVA